MSIFQIINDRDFLFELQKVNILSIYAHIIDHNILKIFVKNNIDHIINLSRKVRLETIINYETKMLHYRFL